MASYAEHCTGQMFWAEHKPAAISMLATQPACARPDNRITNVQKVRFAMVCLKGSVSFTLMPNMYLVGSEGNGWP